jgi:hypothetical protein
MVQHGNPALEKEENCVYGCSGPFLDQGVFAYFTGFTALGDLLNYKGVFMF